MKTSLTSVKVKFRPSTQAAGAGSIVYSVTRHRIVRTHTTEYKVYPSEWDPRKATVATPSEPGRKELCLSIAQHIRWDLALLAQIVAGRESSGRDYSAQDVVAEFLQQKDRQSFFHFMQGVISRLRMLGSDGTCHNYTATLNSISDFRQGQDIQLPEVTQELVEEYHAWLIRKGARPNTVSFYMRNLRATYNRAVEQGLVKDAKPFAKAFTKNERTMKRAIPIAEVKRLKELDLSLKPRLEFARDLFLFLFYCRGMSFIDAAFLRTADIKGSEIVYRRHKTNQELAIGINKHIATLLKRYHREGDEFLLPILGNDEGSRRTRYETALRTVNNSLKKVGELAKLSIPLTTYVSRHSWASIAKSKGIPTSVISDALGHDSEQTTQIYLATISAEAINQANDKILEDL